MPRRSAASLAVVPASSSTLRLMPPSHLDDRERAIFLDLVTSLPVSHFQPCDLPLLARYCEVTALAERAAEAMRGDVVSSEGEPSAWVGVYTAMIKASLGLSLKLRLSPQSRAPNTPRRGPAVSYYERMELEGRREQG